ncbi:MAG TPA: hypothetical protein PLO99_14680 [Chitinophagaceae bacterium]|nr:hypothetical protein [Chitinophagaceae bacterium]
MKSLKYSLAFLFFCCATASFAQTAQVMWGEEFKLKIRDADLHVAWADNTGTYFIEEHLVLTSYFIIGSTSRESAGLVKLDKGLNELYRKNFDKELRKKRYQDILFSKKKMYLLSSDYDKGTRTISFFAMELNKANGEAQGDWKEISVFKLDTKRDDLKFKCTLTEDSLRFRVVTAMDGEKDTRYTVQEFNENFAPVFNRVDIVHEMEPEKIDLEDILPIPNGNILFVARQMDYEEGKKEKKRNLVFQNYNLRLYDSKGTFIKEVNPEVEGRWLVNSKSVVLKNGEIGLAAFYSSTKKAREINGLMMMRINSTDGSVISHSNQEISASMFTNEYEEDDEEDEDETRAEKAERKRFEKLSKDEDGISRSYKIRALTPSMDGGMAFVAEKFYTYTVRQYNQTTRTWSTYIYYISEDLIISKFDESGKITWIKLLPKRQQEQISSGTIVSASDYFVSRFQFPLWGGVSVFSIPGKNTFSILMNDNPKNEDVTRAGQKAKAMYNPKKSHAFLLNVDLATGEIKRKFLFNNQDGTPAMLRHGVLMGNIFYMVGKRMATLGILSKPRIAVGKLTFK